MQIGIAVCGAPHCCVGRRRLQSLLQTCSCRSCLLSVLGGMCGAIALLLWNQVAHWQRVSFV